MLFTHENSAGLVYKVFHSARINIHLIRQTQLFQHLSFYICSPNQNSWINRYMWPEYTYRSQTAMTCQSVCAFISSIYLPMLVTLRTSGHGIYVTLIWYMHHATTRSHTAHYTHSQCTNKHTCVRTAMH